MNLDDDVSVDNEDEVSRIPELWKVKDCQEVATPANSKAQQQSEFRMFLLFTSITNYLLQR